MKKIGPILILLGVLIIGAFLGYAWGISDVSIVDTGLWQLHPSYQGIYVQAVADAYAFDKNEVLAAERLSFLCQADGGLNAAIEEAQKRYGSDPIKKANLDQLATLVRSNQVVQNPGIPVCNVKPVSEIASYARFAWIGLLVAAILIVVGVMFLIRPSEEGIAAPAAARPAAVPGVAAPPAGGPERGRATLPALGKKPPVGPETARSAAAAGAQISAAVEKTDFARVGSEPPVVQFMTTYLHGDDLYDDSFSIETPSGEFLGETGVGISETISEAGDGKKVMAFEVWLFDKNDIRTVTKVLMSDHAFNDDAIRARLAPKGEAVLAKSGDKLVLETATLRVQARIVDLAYGSGPLPPNSFFERITIELAAWKRQGQPATTGAPGGTPPSGLPSINS